MPECKSSDVCKTVNNAIKYTKQKAGAGMVIKTAFNTSINMESSMNTNEQIYINSYNDELEKIAKRRKLVNIETVEDELPEGVYLTDEQEDIASIAQGISGFKGNVHLSFGEILCDEYDSAEDVAGWLDKQIIDHYVLHPSNYFAYEKLYGELPEGVYSSKRLPFNAPAMSKEKRIFEERLETVPEHLREYVLKAYANPIISKREFALK